MCFALNYKSLGLTRRRLFQVQRDLEFHLSGTYDPDQTSKGEFSKDNWERRTFTKKDGEVVTETPKYWVETVERLKSSTWRKIGERIQFWWSEGVGESKKKRRGRSQSATSSSGPSDVEETFVLLSEESGDENEVGDTGAAVNGDEEEGGDDGD